MTFVQPNHGRRGIDIPAPVNAADGNFPAGFAGVSVHQPDLSSVGSRLDSGVFRADFLWRAYAGYRFGAAGSQSIENLWHGERLYGVLFLARVFGADAFLYPAARYHNNILLLSPRPACTLPTERTIV